MNKTYLGDGVFVEIDNGMFKLTTERSTDGRTTDLHYIYLEPGVFYALKAYVERTLNLNPS